MLGNRKLQALLLPALLLFALASWADAGARYDSQIQTAVNRQLQKPEFSGVKASVRDGAVTLQGTVTTYKQKLDAGKKVRKQDHVKSINNELTVAGVSVPDVQLRDRLAKSLRYDRVGYGNLFNALALGVKDGVVTLTGEVRTPLDHDSAVATVVATPGVKGVIDQVKVAPTSFFDDAVRLRVARAIYGDPALSKYAIDPAAPIRIVVDNGHVGLYGTVDSNFDRQIAYMRASQVFGAFSVENYLSTTQASR